MPASVAQTWASNAQMCEDGRMQKTRKRSIVWAAALCLGLSFSGYAAADTSADKPKPPAKEGGGKVKTGEACKVDADCDQSGRPQRCRDAKCAPMPTHPVT